MTALAAFPCRQLCEWRPTTESRGSMRVFTCLGCGSEWTRDQAWRPADQAGQVPPVVVREINSDRT